MSTSGTDSVFYIGWDVGGWNCDKNPNSRDAIVILDHGLSIIGTPWRGNLRQLINRAVDSQEFISSLFKNCSAGIPPDNTHFTLAIDTPLGFSEHFLDLANKLEPAGDIGQSQSNPYLFRRTEHFLFENGLTPLSAIKDMIGSQSTKGMHVLAKFAASTIECGVWGDGDKLTAIEAYPSACKGSSRVNQLLESYPTLDKNDCQDALICALVGYLFTADRPSLALPEAGTSSREGWIWVPRDALVSGGASAPK